MKPQTVENARQMLVMLTSGHSLELAGRAFGISRSTADREVKRLVELLIANNEIDDFVGDERISVERIRQAGPELLEAARRYDGSKAGKKSAPLSASWLEGGISRIRSRSDNANRDVALVCVLLATGAKPIEIAKLEVRDYLDAPGDVRQHSEMRAEVAANGLERPLHFTSRMAIDAIDAYLTERVRRGIGAGRTQRFRGLDPLSKLFLTELGEPFAVTQRGHWDQRETCRLILGTYQTIFRRAGWFGFSAQRARQHVATELYRRGADVGQVGELLGLKSERAVRRLIEQRGSESLDVLTKDIV